MFSRHDGKVAPEEKSMEQKKADRKPEIEMIVQTLLPVINNSGSAKLINPRLPLNFNDLLDGKLVIVPSEAYGKTNLPSENLESCFKPKFNENGVSVTVARECNGRPLFARISKYTATLGPRVIGSMKVRFSADGVSDADKFPVDITPRTLSSPGLQKNFRVHIVLSEDDDGADFKEKWSLDSDDCRSLPVVATTSSGDTKKSARVEKAPPQKTIRQDTSVKEVDLGRCGKYLNGKTYRLGTFSDVMKDRSSKLILGELEKISGRDYKLIMEFSSVIKR